MANNLIPWAQPRAAKPVIDVDAARAAVGRAKAERDAAENAFNAAAKDVTTELTDEALRQLIRRKSEAAEAVEFAERRLSETIRQASLAGIDAAEEKTRSARAERYAPVMKGLERRRAALKPMAAADDEFAHLVRTVLAETTVSESLAKVSEAGRNAGSALPVTEAAIAALAAHLASPIRASVSIVFIRSHHSSRPGHGANFNADEARRLVSDGVAVLEAYRADYGH